MRYRSLKPTPIQYTNVGRRMSRIIFTLLFLFGFLNVLYAVKPTQSSGNLKHAVPSSNIYRFPGLVGPDSVSTLPPLIPASWRTYSQGSESRLEILLTDTASSWLGLVFGLHTIGVPFSITTDYKTAFRHHVVMLYPAPTSQTINANEAYELREFVAYGGTLIGINVQSGALSDLFGFSETADASRLNELHYSNSVNWTKDLQDDREHVALLGNPKRQRESLAAVSYSSPTEAPIATYENASAAIIQSHLSYGSTFAFGFDLGYYLLWAYDGRLEELGRNYVNQYEPVADVLLMLIRQIYQTGNHTAVTIGTVPGNKLLSVIFTHDIDYSKSVFNSMDYAKYEKSQGIRATYFMQTKYIRDWNDIEFFDPPNIDGLRRLDSMGTEIASHTVSHSRSMQDFPIGTGAEQYPSYIPFVKEQYKTYNGSIFGELRVSKFLLEHFLANQVVSFRPGHLSNPMQLPEALTACGYRYSSSITANSCLTHLPYQLAYSRLSSAVTPIFEFPITFEDEALPKMGDRLQDAITVANKIARYGGSVVILIHPDILDHKLAFEKGFVEAFKSKAWFGSISDFGGWWATRNDLSVEVLDNKTSRYVLQINAQHPIEDLPVKLPDNATIEPVDLVRLNATLSGNTLLFKSIKDSISVNYVVAEPKR